MGTERHTPIRTGQNCSTNHARVFGSLRHQPRAGCDLAYLQHHDRSFSPRASAEAMKVFHPVLGWEIGVAKLQLLPEVLDEGAQECPIDGNRLSLHHAG